MMKRTWLLAPLLPAALALCAAAPGAFQTSATDRLQAWDLHVRLLATSPFRGLHWEALGPSMQGARVETIAVPAPGSSTIYVGPGAGNIWKTTNNGMSWQPIFEHESAFAIGHIAVAPSNPDIVWVGTGEVQPRHSGPAYSGTGVFKTTDGGRSWRHMGLADTFHIGRIVIDPRNPDVVYVAAMGHFWSANAERGVFKTTDGGRTWTKSLYISDRTGVIDLATDPSDSKTLYAGAWQMVSGPESGIYRTSDAGRTWKKLGGGLPAGPLGRSGLDVSRSNPRVVYTFLDNNAPYAGGAKGRTIVGGEVYRSDDRGETWHRANTDDLYPVFGIYGWKFCDVRVSPANENEIYILGNRMFHSTDGGRTYGRVGETIRRVNALEGTAMHLDHHDLWIDPADPKRLLLGNDGGVFTSYDGGATWLHLNNIPIAQFYTIAVDKGDPYTIYGGTQDDGALYVSSTYRLDDEPAANDGWRHVWLDRWTGGDAFVTLPDPTDPRFVYYEHQNGDMRRMNLAMGNPFSGGPATESIQPRVARGEPPVRFGWFTPFLVSQHDPRTLYAGANVVFKSTSRGASWRTISPDLGEPAGGERAVVPYGALTTLAESPFAPGILYAGTEGGAVYATRNDGATWTKVSAGLPAKWVTRVVASEHDAGVVYVSMSGYREEDFAAYLYRSADSGATWASIAANLPPEPINVIREDPKRPEILYVGTDAGVYVSLDRGRSWVSLAADLPTTPVMDLVVHPREDELIVATHGRGMFLLDVRPLQAFREEVRSSPLHLFDLRPVTLRWQVGREVAPHPPRGRARVHYFMQAGGPLTITIRNATGEVARTLAVAAAAPGLNRADWDIRRDDGTDAPPGIYRVEVTANGRTVAGRLIVHPFGGTS
jgi:photosystem II stability/assembly factor-like uncharacterized protein